MNDSFLTTYFFKYENKKKCEDKLIQPSYTSKGKEGIGELGVNHFFEKFNEEQVEKKRIGNKGQK